MDWKKFWRKVLFPPVWLIIILTIFSAAVLVLVFAKCWESSPAASIAYVMSFYALTILSLAFWKVFPKYYGNIKEIVYRNKYANQYLTDVTFKTNITLYRSLAINLLYVAVNAVSAVIYRTCWFAIFAVYYGIMAVMRFLLLRYVRRTGIGVNRLEELKRARFCSYILTSVNVALSGAVLMMVYYNRGFEYQGFLIYVVAIYTFYSTITASIDMVKYRKYKSPVMSVSKVIKLASALFSVLFLETAMFSQFGADTSPEAKRIMIMATGAGISVIVVATALYMIICTTKEMKEIRREDGYGKQESEGKL